ncbi:DUF6890 family protein [Dickeya zeae]|uniref:DUF6890 family protein n=1 Tax=Dickeya zeae TaxID=204042 RepID=UPI0035A87FB8
MIKIAGCRIANYRSGECAICTEAGNRSKKLTQRLRAIENNFLEQALTLRRHYLPAENDDADNLARAVWLANTHWENMRISVANGIALALKGDS